MGNRTTRNIEPVKGTGLVRGLGMGLLDYGGLPAWAKVVTFLGCHGGDAHASNHHDWHVLVGLPERTYYRVLGQLESQEVIEICTDERCPHRFWGELGWRFTLRFTRWLDRPDSPYATAMGGRESLPLVAVPDLTEPRGTQVERGTRTSAEVKKRTAYAAGCSAPGPKKEVVMTDDWVDRTFGQDPDAPSPRKKRKVPKRSSPATRIRLAFEDECYKLTQYWGVPITPSVGRMMAGIKWLLDQGYTEQEIIASFRYFPNVLPRQSVGAHRTMWDVFYQHKAELLQQGANDKVGRRPGEKRESLLDVARRKNRAVQ